MQKRLYRSEKDKMLGGVCAGIADYLNIDPVIVRVIFVLIFLAEGIGLMIYVLLWIIVPEEKSTKTDPKEIVEENSKEIEENVKKVTKGLKKKVRSDTAQDAEEKSK